MASPTLGDAIAEIQRLKGRLQSAGAIVADLLTLAELDKRPTDADIAKARAWLREYGRG